MTGITLRSPATIANVGPGFDIFALSLDEPRDLISLELNDTGRVTVKVAGGDVALPTEPEKNTAGLAAIHFLRITGLKLGVDIEIRKGMPSCSGLGSSAASAAAAAWGLNRLAGDALKPDEIIEIASLGEAASGGTPHADNVSACLLGGFVFIRQRRPVLVERIEIPAIPIVLQVRRKAQTTTRGQIPAEFSLDAIKAQMSRCAAVVRALMAGDAAAFGWAVNEDGISEPVRSRGIPGYARLKAAVLEAGAHGFNVSGGGSSVFAVCPEDKVDAVAEAMRAQAAAAGEAAAVIKTRASNSGLREIHGL